MRLMRFHIKDVQHVPGKLHYTADTLSRKIPESTVQPTVEENEMNAYVLSVIDALPASNPRLKEIQQAQDKDEESSPSPTGYCSKEQDWSFHPACNAKPSTKYTKVTKVSANAENEPKYPFEKVTYLLVVDYYSRYVEVVALHKSTSPSKIIQALKTVFARHGIPDEVRSDNGPQYHSDEFAQFAKEWGFKHSISSPHCCQANGKVERAVKTVKNILKKEHDQTKALLAYRSTPLASGHSPAEPITLPHLTPQLPNQKLFIQRDEVYRSKQKKNFDNRYKAQPLKPLPPGATVYTSQTWIVPEQ
ncbi:Transposon Tf2-8 poly [Paramuricea clavata]|uniref:Transposon Tf2-8 poly n=1 Tax=Paramuricea clavata TaxID=317549 RepID=A0A6S7K5B5_PARCT|nr:Transposon Tf2-8 poly [Paramuricea clavata]